MVRLTYWMCVSTVVSTFFAIGFFFVPQAWIKVTCIDLRTDKLLFQTVADTYYFEARENAIPSVCRYEVINLFQAYRVNQVDNIEDARKVLPDL